MILRTYPKHSNKQPEWLELDVWNLVKTYETKALIFHEPEGSQTKGFFECVDVTFKVKEDATNFYLKVEPRRIVVNPATKHIRKFAGVWVRNLENGMTHKAVFNERDRREYISLPHVFFVDVEVSEPQRISVKVAQELIEGDMKVLGVFKERDLLRQVM